MVLCLEAGSHFPWTRDVIAQLQRRLLRCQVRRSFPAFRHTCMDCSLNSGGNPRCMFKQVSHSEEDIPYAAARRE